MAPEPCVFHILISTTASMTIPSKSLQGAPPSSHRMQETASNVHNDKQETASNVNNDKQETAGKVHDDKQETAGNVHDDKQETDRADDDTTEADYLEYISKDSAAKQQFEYDKTIGYLNDLPEIHENTSLSVAPGEGCIPKYILSDPYWDNRTFSVLQLDPEKSLNEPRDINVRSQDKICQSLFNIKEECSKSSAYLFGCTQYIETKQLQGNINIAYKRGKKTMSDQGLSYSLDDPYRVLDNIKGTPAYFRKKKIEFVSKSQYGKKNPTSNYFH